MQEYTGWFRNYATVSITKETQKMSAPTTTYNDERDNPKVENYTG